MPHSYKHGTELCCNRMMIMTMPYWTESGKKKKSSRICMITLQTCPSASLLGFQISASVLILNQSDSCCLIKTYNLKA